MGINPRPFTFDRYDHLVSALDTAASGVASTSSGAGTVYDLGHGLSFTETLRGPRGRHLRVSDGARLVLDLPPAVQGELVPTVFIQGPWLARVYSKAAACAWVYWDKPKTCRSTDRTRRDQQTIPSQDARLVARGVASAVAAQGRVEDDGTTTLLETGTFTGALTLAGRVAILTVNGTRGLAMVAVLDRRSPHRVIRVQCYEPGMVCPLVDRGIGLSPSHLTEFCRRR